jgi:hypothetical protein
MNNLFLACFLAGLGLSVISFVSGLDRIRVFDHVFGHGHHGSGHHTKFGKGTRDVSALNMAAITAFLAWFGGGGLVLEQVTRWAAVAVFAGAAVTGAIGGNLVNRLLRTLLRSERPLEQTPICGTIGRVTVPIRQQGTGEVVFTLGGTRHVSAARADDGDDIVKGTEVVIIREERGIAYVSTWER